eukprot:5522656-Pleurochrysis_carterae.AAC.1
MTSVRSRFDEIWVAFARSSGRSKHIIVQGGHASDHSLVELAQHRDALLIHQLRQALHERGKEGTVSEQASKSERGRGRGRERERARE